MQPNQNRKFLSRLDIVIVAVILAAAAVFYIAGSGASNKNITVQADIYYDTKLVKTVQLKPGVSEEFPVPGQPDVILEVSDGKICFHSSTCRDKICIKSGWLSRPGETAACLPNRVAVKIVATGAVGTGQADTYIK